MCEEVCNERAYLQALSRVLEAPWHENRTGVPARTALHEKITFSLYDETGQRRLWPLLTSRRVPWKVVLRELCWFLSGETNTSMLARDGVKIWEGNTSREFLDARGLAHLQPGETGPIYGAQWRTWGGRGVDQVQRAIDLLREDPTSRRALVSAWNAEDIEKMVLPPCHYAYQFIVLQTEHGARLNCIVSMRSADMPVGVPFNVASYALLTHLVSEITGILPGALVMSLAAPHVYQKNEASAREQLTRANALRAAPSVRFAREIANLADCVALRPEDIILEGYDPHPGILLEMVV